MKTTVSEAADATFKTYGIEAWSIDGLLTGLRWGSIDPAPYDTAKQTEATKVSELMTAEE